MLILKMKIGSELRIGPVRICFMSRKGNWIKVGIDSPRDLYVQRIKANGEPARHSHLPDHDLESE